MAVLLAHGELPYEVREQEFFINHLGFLHQEAYFNILCAEEFFALTPLITL
jgi:hypothetical protein